MQQQQQMLRKAKAAKGKGKKATSKRPKSGTRKPKQAMQQQQQQPGGEQMQIPEDQLQQLIQLLQEQQIDLENVDPNIIQQLLYAQQQQMMQPH